MEDTRNVVNEFKGMSEAAIISVLDERGVSLEIAIENILRDFNMGSIVRSANAFGVRTIHIVGRRQWNKRGAMMTDKYLNLEYHASPKEFSAVMRREEKVVYALENNLSSDSIFETTFPKNAVLLFGQEGPGLSDELLAVADHIVTIDQLGSTRSINVGVAAGIAMYEWIRQYNA